MLGVPLQIGPVRLESNLMLAPIAGWSDLAWRITCRELGGVGLACTDLLSPHGLLAGGEKSLDLARTNDLDQPVGMQLYGSDRALLADAAKWCADHGATVVDINMGCPVDKVTKKDGGSKLMCDIPRTVRTAEAIRDALPGHIPLTAKMRLGWDEEAYEFLLDLAYAKAQQAPAVLRGHATRAWLRRWTALLSKAGMDSFASTLVHGTAKNTELWTSSTPYLGAVLCGTQEAPQVSRLGPR